MPTLEYQINHVSYDSDGISGAYHLGDASMEFGSINNVNYQWVGLTWYYPTIPVNAIITAAYLKINVSGITGTTPNPMRIYFDDSDANANVASYADIIGRDRTDAYIDFAVPAGSSGWINTADISSIIQELVNSYDYSAGDKMMTAILFALNINADKYASVTTYDGNPALSPILHIEYVLPAGGQVRVIGMMM